MTVYAFHGGIHPPENKLQSTLLPVAQANLPSHLIIPVLQHIGMAADPVVKVGDLVLKGQVIAEPVGRISAAIHAPSSGRIIDISQQPVPHASGLEAECIVIETDGAETWCEYEGLEDYTQIPPHKLIDFIRSKGIAGMGGAGFPTDVKLHLGDDHIVNTLIINAAECEPYITADDMLMRTDPEAIIGGIEVIAHLLKPHHILIGIEDNKPEAIAALNRAAEASALQIDIQVVPTKYPSGGERQLIQLLTNIEVPSGKIPADVGIVCQNVGTTAAIYEAVTTGRPLISRIVTLTGDALAQPQNYRTLLGTPFTTLLEQAGVDQQRLSKLIMGGPMMGVPVTSPHIPVIKTTNCIIATTVEEMPAPPPAQACIRCGLCEQACPAQLLPQQLYWFSKGKEFEKARQHNLFDCIECGACAYVCPSNIPLVQYYRFAKSELRNEELEQRRADHARARFEARQERLEREAAEKAEKRKQRAIEAAAAQAARKKAQQQAQAETATENSSAASSNEAEVKALKVAAAVARTKLSKAEKALKSARDKGLDGVDKLEATVAQLSAKADEAQAAYDKSLNANNSSLEIAKSDAKCDANQDNSPDTQAQEQSAEELDMKALKQQVSIMRTKLKKAKAGNPESSEIASLESRLAEASATLKAAEDKQIERAAAEGIDLKQLKIDAALAKAAVTKLERAAKAAQSDDERETLEAQLPQKREEADQLAQKLARFE